jgi:hypothetical protein
LIAIEVAAPQRRKSGDAARLCGDGHCLIEMSYD